MAGTWQVCSEDLSLIICRKLWEHHKKFHVYLSMCCRLLKEIKGTRQKGKEVGISVMGTAAFTCLCLLCVLPN